MSSGRLYPREAPRCYPAPARRASATGDRRELRRGPCDTYLPMPRVCTVCTHPERSALNAALIVAEPIPAVSARFGLSESALKRHRAGHLPLALVKAAEAAQITEADALLDQVRAVQRRTRAFEAQAAAAGDVRGALMALREERATLELLARMSGELEGRPVETATLIWGFDPLQAFPDPPPIAGHANGNGGGNGAAGAPGVNGKEGPNGSA